MYQVKDSNLLSQNMDNLFNIKNSRDLITVNSEITSNLQLKSNIVMTLLELISFEDLKGMIRIADDFNMKKKQSSHRTMSLLITHNNEIVNGDIKHCYNNPDDIYPFKGDINFKFTESIIIDFVGSEPVCIRFNITLFDQDSTTHVRYVLPVGYDNKRDNGEYIINGLAKVNCTIDLEDTENYCDFHNYVAYNGRMIDYTHSYDLKITSMGKKVIAKFDDDASYLTNYC